MLDGKAMEEDTEVMDIAYNHRIHEMCRACMSLKCDLTYSLFIGEIKKMFIACTSIELHGDDGLPEQICASCHEQLHSLSIFRNQCIEVDLKLRQLVLSKFSLELINNTNNAKELLEECKNELGKMADSDIGDGTECYIPKEVTDCLDNVPDYDSETPLCSLRRLKRKKMKKSRLRVKLRKKLRHRPTISDNSQMFKMKDKKKIVFNVLPGEQIETNDDGEAVKIKCKLCNKHFYLSENLKEHMKTHEGKTVPECDICNRQFKSIESLRCHKLSHADVKKYSCKICGKSFLFNYVLTHHLGTHTGLKTIPCDQCGKTFRTKSLLETHLQVHSDETPYNCEICNKKFKRSYGLKIHLMRCKGEKNYICVECGKSFAVNADLKIHLRSHTGEKPFACDFCTKKFRTHSHMTLHRRNHTGIRPHACTTCPMKFMTKKALAMHFLIHTGELPHACSICSRPFRQKSALRTHMKTHNIAMPNNTQYVENTKT